MPGEDPKISSFKPSDRADERRNMFCIPEMWSCIVNSELMQPRAHAFLKYPTSRTVLSFSFIRVVKTPRRVARSLDHQLLLTSVAAVLLFLVFLVLDFHLALDAFPNDQDSTAAQGYPHPILICHHLFAQGVLHQVELTSILNIYLSASFCLGS